MSRTILHCDMNNFYASVEMLLNGKLKGKAVAVCGLQEERHGIVLAKSEKAKKFGVKTGETIWQAKQKCKDIIIVSPHYEEYKKYSEMAKEIYRNYTNQVESFGLDECWLDVSGSDYLFGNGETIANLIREQIKTELGLTVSVGVSFNKIFAKLGSDMKKPDAVTCISYNDFREKVWNLPADNLPFVGKATKKKLEQYGINTIGDIAHTSCEFIKKLLGKNGEMLWTYANGGDKSRVMEYGYEATIKSIGRGVTCVDDLKTNEEVYRVFLALSQDVSGRLRDNGLTASGIQVTVRDNELNFSQFQDKTSYPIQSSLSLAEVAKNLFIKNYRWNNYIRALSVRAINLNTEDMPFQLDMFNSYERQIKSEAADKAVYQIRKRFGKNSITMATLLEETKMPGKYNSICSFRDKACIQQSETAV